MLGVNVGAQTIQFLRFCDDVQAERGLAAGFWSVNFYDSTLGKSADARQRVNLLIARGDDGKILGANGIEINERAFSKSLFQFRDSRIGFLCASLYHFAPRFCRLSPTPLTHKNCFKRATGRTKSVCAAITASISLYAPGASSSTPSDLSHSTPSVCATTSAKVNVFSASVRDILRPAP